MKMIKIKRRKLLMAMSLVGIGTVVASSARLARASTHLKILVLGGTGFIGPHIVRAALGRGHEVTLFNRGRSGADLFPGVEKLVGDRDGGLDALSGGQWDAVIDNSGYVPRLVGDSASFLKDRVGRYLFTSSISAYDFTSPDRPLGKDSKLIAWTNPDSEEVGAHYGEFKAQCERLVQQSYGDRALIVRPTYIVGPGDKSQRFTWWVDRVARGGEVLAPGNPDTTHEIIDVRDLAEFYIRLLETGKSGVFNVTGPAGRFSFGGMLGGIRATMNQAVNFTWVEKGFLEAQQVSWKEMPMWSAEDDGFTGIFAEQQTSIEAGLSYRPLVETVNATLEWHRSLSAEERVFTRAGIEPAREKQVLSAWHDHLRTAGR